MTFSWFKLNHYFSDDAIFRRFTVQEKWAWVQLLCLASRSKTRGIITLDDEDIGDFCDFSNTQDWLYYRDKLLVKGMIEITPSGNLEIVGWERNQGHKPSDHPEAIKERVSRHRANKKQKSETTCNALQEKCNATDKDLDPDPDQTRSSDLNTIPQNSGNFGDSGESPSECSAYAQDRITEQRAQLTRILRESPTSPPKNDEYADVLEDWLNDVKDDSRGNTANGTLSDTPQSEEPPPPNPAPDEPKKRGGKKAETIYAEEFEREFWGLVPRKVGKGQARGTYIKLRQKGHAKEDIVARLEYDKQQWAAKGTGTEYIPHPSTWLNREDWTNDGWRPGEKVVVQKVDYSAAHAQIQAWIKLREEAGAPVRLEQSFSTDDPMQWIVECKRTGAFYPVKRAMRLLPTDELLEMKSKRIQPVKAVKNDYGDVPF